MTGDYPYNPYNPYYPNYYGGNPYAGPGQSNLESDVDDYPTPTQLPQAPPPKSSQAPGTQGPGSTPSNIGPKEFPPGEDKDRPDVYLPPYDPADPPTRQFRMRYDSKTDSYVAIGQWDAQTQAWRDFSPAEFRAFNSGGTRIGGPTTEKPGAGPTQLMQVDPKTGKQVCVGVKIGNQNVMLPNLEAARRAAGASHTLPSMPQPKDDEDSGAIILPPASPDGTRPLNQYVMRKDEDSQTWFVCAEYQYRDGQWHKEEYDEATFRRVNADFEYGDASAVPPEDAAHPDYQSMTDDGKKVFYRWFPEEGRYKLAGVVDKGEKLPFDLKSLEMFNLNHEPPHSPAQVTTDDVLEPGDEKHPDRFAPPTGQPGTTSYIFRYDPGTDSYYMIGQQSTDENGTTGEQTIFTAEEFKRRNVSTPGDGNNPAREGDYETADGLIVRPDGKGGTRIVGLRANKDSFYFDATNLADINAEGNVKGDFDPKDVTVPIGPPPKESEGAALGHPDFVAPVREPDHYGGIGIFRWDAQAGRYCCVGEYGANGDNFRMFSTDEYVDRNSGPNALKPPKSAVDFKYPEFAEGTTVEKNFRIAEDELIGLYDAPDSPTRPEKVGKYEEHYPYQGKPIYKTLANGDEVIVGVKVYPENDGRMDTDKDSPRIHYFSQEEYNYYNPGGKAMTDPAQLHTKPWSPMDKTVRDDTNDPSFPGSTAPNYPVY